MNPQLVGVEFATNARGRTGGHASGTLSLSLSLSLWAETEVSAPVAGIPRLHLAGRIDNALSIGARKRLGFEAQRQSPRGAVGDMEHFTRLSGPRGAPAERRRRRRGPALGAAPRLFGLQCRRRDAWVAGGNSDSQRAGADAEVNGRLEVDGLSVNASRHAMISVHLERRRSPLLQPELVHDHHLTR